MSKIIHFEDDQMLRQMYKIKLEESGIEVINFEEPPENVVDVVAHEKPDLIIMDIIMPKMDGYELTMLLKKDSRTKYIPILGFDNLSQKEDIQKALRVGMVDYWIKAHYTPNQFIEKIKALLEKLRT